MENAVPITLQRLRAADIIRIAGLAAASVGQEYCRSGAVHSMFRRGALLVGIVELSPLARAGAIGTGEAQPLHAQANDDISPKMSLPRFPVEVELLSPTAWLSKCSCSCDTQGREQAHLCAHGAALLYQWLAQPSLFQPQDPSSAVEQGKGAVGMRLVPTFASTVPSRLPVKSGTVGVKSTGKNEESDVTTSGKKGTVEVEASPFPTEYLQTLLSQVSLSELRAVAREYGLVTNSVPRQQLAESILAELKKPDVVRRIAATLEKSQRQLLAALILAGGAMSDDDLRGLFERFSLGQPSQLQHILLTLQGKALLFRVSLNASNSASRPHHGLLNSALLDIGWYVPLEVRNALRVSVPVTPFDVTNVAERGTSGAGLQNVGQELRNTGQELRNVGQARILHPAETSGPLAMLLLVARLLDGYTPDTNEMWYERSELRRALEAGKGKSSPSLTPGSGLPSVDGSVAMLSPEDLPPSSLLQELQERILWKEGAVPTSQLPSESRPAFLRFIMRVLGVVDLLHKGEGQSAALCLRSGTTERLLGPDWAQTLRTFFKLWLTQTSYGDLYDLNEEQIRLRCRAHVGQSVSQPMLRSSELDAENSQARQSIIALLAQAPLNQWISFSAFARFVYRLNPLFLQRRYQWGRTTTGYAALQWWLELEEGRPLRPLQLNDWLRAEFFYLRHLIAGPLHWWGACDIITSADGNLQAFRLTPIAGWLFNGNLGQVPLQLEEEPQEEDDYQQYVATLDVTDANEILIACSVQNWPVIQLLEIFTEATGVQQGLLAYRISARAFGLALGRGLRPFVLLRLLRLAAEVKADSDAKRAQQFTQIATRFEQWFVGYSRIRLYTGVTLLETVDTAVMREVVATTSLEEALVQNIHSTLCIVKPHKIGHIVDELKQRGQSPLLHDEDL